MHPYKWRVILLRQKRRDYGENCFSFWVPTKKGTACKNRCGFFCGCKQWGRENESEPCLVIGADTVVAFEGKILGKPSDEEDALDTLLKLQGKSHQVYTGVTLLVKEQGIWKPYTFSERTDVEFYPVSREELLEYIKTGEPMDKAGSYGIQGKFGIYVKGICGDYNNVVGLPVGRLVYELKKMKIDIRGMRK